MAATARGSHLPTRPLYKYCAMPVACGHVASPVHNPLSIPAKQEHLGTGEAPVAMKRTGLSWAPGGPPTYGGAGSASRQNAPQRRPEARHAVSCGSTHPQPPPPPPFASSSPCWGAEVAATVSRGPSLPRLFARALLHGRQLLKELVAVRLRHHRQINLVLLWLLLGPCLLALGGEEEAPAALTVALRGGVVNPPLEIAMRLSGGLG